MSKQNELAQLADAVTVDGSNVGIGTNNPLSSVHMAASSGVTGYGNSIFLIEDTGSDYSGVMFKGQTNYNAAIRSEGSSAMTFWRGDTSGTAYFTETMRLDASGRVTMPYQPSFSVSKTGGAVGSGTFVIWNHVEHNVGSHYNSSNGVFTAPVSGVYAVSLNVMDETSSTHVNTELDIYRNSYIYQRVYGTNGVGGSHGRWTWSGNIYMSANDTLKVLVNNMTIYGTQRDYSNFSGFLVG